MRRDGELPRGGGLRATGNFGCRNSQAVDAAKARCRKAGLARPVPMERRCPASPNQLTNLAERPVAEPPGGRDEIFGFHPSPDEPGTGASAGRHSETTLRGRSRERRQALSVLRGPHAGESGVGRKAGPISVFGYSNFTKATPRIASRGFQPASPLSAKPSFINQTRFLDPSQLPTDSR